MRVPSGPNRPLSVRVLVWILALFGLWNGVRAFVLWRQLTWLTGLELVTPVPLQIGLAVIWAALFLIAIVALWRGSEWARPGVPMLLLAYALSELSLPGLFGAGAPATINLLSYAVLIGVSWWLLNLPPTNLYFDSHNVRRQRSDASHEPQD